MTAEREPRTEAGKALHDWLGRHPIDARDAYAYILAIEEQAATEARRELDVRRLINAIRSAFADGIGDPEAVARTIAREYETHGADLRRGRVTNPATDQRVQKALERRRLIKESDRG